MVIENNKNEMNNITATYVLVKQSDLYPASHFRSGLFFTALVIMTLYFIPINWEDPIWMLYFEVGAFFFGYLFAYNRKVKRFFTFKSEMKEEVYQKALETMADYGLLGKSHYIFLFASQVEKRLECIYSPEIEELISEKDIERSLANAKSLLKNQKYKEAMEQGISSIMDLLPKIERTEILPLAQVTTGSKNLIDLKDDKANPEAENQISEE